MKLLITGSGSYKSGLTAFRAVPLGQAMSRAGWEVTLVVPSADKYNGFKEDKKAVLDGVRISQPWQLKTKSPFINLLPYMFSALKEVIKDRPDLIYMFKPSPANITGLIMKMIYKTTIVVDFDDLGSEVMRQQKQPKLQVWLVAACERLALRQADVVTVTSSYLYESIKRKYPDKQVLVISNGVDPAVFRQCPLSSPRRAIYYLGALNRLSLVENLLKALPETISKVPGTEVIIMGAGRSLDEAKDLTADLGIQGSVRFTGWITPEEIHEHVRFADIAVCTQPDNPTVRAASNLKVFQYMALGTVPVVSRVGDLPRYVGSGSDGEAVGEVVLPEDISGLSRTLVGLLLNPERRTELSLRARARAENIYTWDKLAVKLDLFLKTLADDRGSKVLGEEAGHA